MVNMEKTTCRVYLCKASISTRLKKISLVDYCMEAKLIFPIFTIYVTKLEYHILLMCFSFGNTWS